MAETQSLEEFREPGSIDGEWVLTLASVEPGNSATIQVAVSPSGGEEPRTYDNGMTLGFVWLDGRRQVWSWAHLLSASYTPPVRAAR
jgi:hypothetical protein